MALCLFVVRSVYAGEIKYVEIKKPFVNIYKYLDPKSTVIKQGKKGDFYELIYDGNAWFQIKVKDEVGWLDKQSGVVVNAPKFLFASLPFGTFALFLILLIGTIAAVSFVIYRHRNAEL
jgi:hypothetical protein